MRRSKDTILLQSLPLHAGRGTTAMSASLALCNDARCKHKQQSTVMNAGVEYFVQLEMPEQAPVDCRVLWTTNAYVWMVRVAFMIETMLKIVVFC